MTRKPGTGCSLLPMTCVLTLLFTASLSATPHPRSLVDRPLVISKSPDPLPAKTKEFLTERNPQVAKVWLFFTDKGVFDQNDFAARAAGISLRENVLKRRAKVNRDHVLFADLPVVEEYIAQVVDLGGKLRRVSRWLNAASFELPLAILDKVGQLPFVVTVKPVAAFKRLPKEAEESGTDSPSKSGDPQNGPDYGNAQIQLEQINVPAVHAKGYHGEGVTLAMLDTGYRKTHQAFAQHYADGRVLAEYDFVFNDENTANESGDWSDQWNHGTYIWSTSSGEADGVLYGPAYKANFLLAKTEDIRSETPVEEDNWVAALEWADSLGADVVTSSLGYSDWYNYWDMNGQTATTTLAANTAAGLGIVVCNSMGNSGPGATTLTAPADAFDILAVGAVNSGGILASFSSRGPTWDERTKPEVCAMGVSTACATTGSDYSYSTRSGTSLSTPLVAGAACLLIQAHPTYPPQFIRLALMETAHNADSPNNDYGWGIIDVGAALGWGATFDADIRIAEAPFTVQFTDLSTLSPTSWIWSFGDGDSAFVQNPSHQYGTPGTYDVSLAIETEYGGITREEKGFIIALGDTLTFVSDSGFAGHQAVMSVHLVNSQALNRVVIPFKTESSPSLTVDSASLGERTGHFETIEPIAWDPWNNKYTFNLVADDGGGSPPLPPGSGEIMRLYFSIGELELGGLSNSVDTAAGAHALSLTSEYVTYSPAVVPGTVSTIYIIRGDVDYSQQIDISDLLYMVEHSFNNGPEPVTIQSMDVNADLQLDIEDILYMVEYMFNDGPPPPSP